MERIMEVIIDEIMKSPAVTKMLILALMLIVGYGIRVGCKILSKYYKSIMNEMKLLGFKQEAMDSALAHSLKNGYKAERDRKFQELKDNDEFIKS